MVSRDCQLNAEDIFSIPGGLTVRYIDEKECIIEVGLIVNQTKNDDTESLTRLLITTSSDISSTKFQKETKNP